ncbi:MAG: hypothetical protein LQ343_001636 [Gyalolechia ehrenbergii]|nr:MAG: hypothetical protein LQ343_001636 [Gyalolechia ehrenbergii]
MIGCIPRSPSPVLVHRSTEAPNASNDSSVQVELRMLRARLAKLEGRTDTTAPESSIKAEQSSVSSTVKRERDNNENEPLRKRSRPSGPIETVDLTDD